LLEARLGNDVDWIASQRSQREVDRPGVIVVEVDREARQLSDVPSAAIRSGVTSSADRAAKPKGKDVATPSGVNGPAKSRIEETAIAPR
jgi:hypothetical protein